MHPPSPCHNTNRNSDSSRIHPFMASTQKEIELLSRVAANHLFLGQFEPLRACILSLRKRDPNLALSFLRTIVSEGGQVAGVNWSDPCPSPSHLAWLASLELGNSSPDRLQVEFLLLIQLVLSKISETNDEANKHSVQIQILNRLLNLGLKRLKRDGDYTAVSEDELSHLWGVFVANSEIFYALCSNITRQVPLGEGSSSNHEGLEGILVIRKSVQLAHLDAIKECLTNNDFDRACSHLRFLHLDHGVQQENYKMGIRELVMKCCITSPTYGEVWLDSRSKMMLVYSSALQSSCMKLVQMIQLIHDEVFSEEIEQHRILVDSVPLPLEKFLETLSLEEGTNLESKPLSTVAVGACMGDLYHYSRILGTHSLGLILETALSLIQKEKLQEACDVVSVFPLLRPLVAVLGWDLLSGKTALRRKLMGLFWRCQSQSLHLEKSSIDGKQTDEVSCVEHLCDVLCFRLDLASFVASVNSSHLWGQQSLPCYPQKDEMHDMHGEGETVYSDSFVENLVLERLAAQTPLRVLFDVVPEIRYKDAIKFIESQPIASTTGDLKRSEDIELMHMRFTLELAVLALGAIEAFFRDGNGEDRDFELALSYLREMQTYMEAIKNVSRRVFMVSIVISLLYMDNLSPHKPYLLPHETLDFKIPPETGNNRTAISFLESLLNILKKDLPEAGPTTESPLNTTGLSSAGKQALEWRMSNSKNSIKDLNWRLSVLQRFEKPLSGGEQWAWKDVLVLLRAPPSKLLNLCMQRGKYDIGEEMVRRYSLSPDDKAVLELARWINSPSRIRLDISPFRAQLGPLPTILLCMDSAAASAKSQDMCKFLLDQASKLLSEIFPGKKPKIGSSAYWDQVQEAAMITVTKRVLQRLHGLLEMRESVALQEIFSLDPCRSQSNVAGKLGQKQRALVILHQMIDDAFKGKRQFLTGKLHNLARVVTDEDSYSSYSKGEPSSYNTGIVLGLGLGFTKTEMKTELIPPSSVSENGAEIKELGNSMIYGPVPSKPATTYLSSFIIYIATIGDIFDGVDTTHDFNYFSLVYESPRDLLTHLVFERGSTDAAAKVADVMCVDFVHEIISSCVPPVYPPKYGHGWARIPILSTVSENQLLLKDEASRNQKPLYPLQLTLVKHLANLSPVRAVLACVFGSTILSGDSESERSFYEFALEQSERYPTLNRWIQMQSNLHRVSESSVSDKNDDQSVSAKRKKGRARLKRSREERTDSKSKPENVLTSDRATENNGIVSPGADRNRTICISFDWENEGPYEKAVDRLINEGKLIDALALSDRCLPNGASDRLLQLLIEREEEKNNNINNNNNNNNQVRGQSRDFGSTTWQYCLRLRDKRLAARLALKYLNKWDLDAAINVLTMCICHLPENDQLTAEVLQRKKALQRYSHVLGADDQYSNWQEVEEECKRDSEGLALRLAGKGAVSAALLVAESESTSQSQSQSHTQSPSINIRRELQGRQLVKLLTTDPLNGGGPAAASRFLSSLPDSDDALPVAIGAMQQLPDLRSKQLLVHFFLKRKVGNLSEADTRRLNSWALGLRVLSLLPLLTQQKCSALHEHPSLILEVLLMMKQLQSASLVLKEFPSLRDDMLIKSYAQKSISVNIASPPRESARISISSSRQKQKKQMGPTIQSKIPNLAQSIGKALLWASREQSSSSKGLGPKDEQRKRKSSGLGQSETASLAASSSAAAVAAASADGQERVPLVSVTEEWVLTGDLEKDNSTRLSHKYDTSPDITLFKALLSLCSSELVAAKIALELCTEQMKVVLSSQHLPLSASMETMSRAYHATEAYVQALAYARSLLRKLAGAGGTGSADMSSGSERSRGETDSALSDSTAGSGDHRSEDDPADLLVQAELWLSRAELLQSLLGSGISASLDEIFDRESSVRLRDRLIQDERYSMAIYTCKKCKIDAFPVWNAWGHALICMEHYAQARVKFKQAIQLYKGDITPVVLDIINTVEGGPPVDVSSVRSMYEHLAKSVATILDDSLSADAYLNVLYMPSTFPRSERSRQSLDSSRSSVPSGVIVDDGPRSNLDAARYAECIHYLQEYKRPQMLQFMFRHGHYSDACSLFFQQSDMGPVAPAQTQRSDQVSTDYWTVDELCDLCIGYGAMLVLAETVSSLLQSQTNLTTNQYVNSVLARICTYCETHRHFNYLYEFLVIKGDHVAAGLCCIQLFVNSMSQEEALKHLSHAETHFEEALSARDKQVEPTKLVSKTVRGKSASEKLTKEMIVKFQPRVSYQMDVVKALNSAEGPQWKTSLFGNPSDPETFRRRCVVVETLAEKHFDLSFRMLHEFDLPAVDIYAGVAASLAERKRGGQLTEFFKNIKGTVDDDAWDLVLSTAINVYANKHKERPDRLIDMLISSHRKVLACVVCGRLKSAFQIASRSGSVADVQYVAHQALYANALPVLDMCKQWLAQYM